MSYNRIYNFLYAIIAIFLTLTFFPVFFVVVFLPCFLIRKFAILCAKLKPTLLRELNVNSCHMAIDPLYSTPVGTVVTVFYVKGRLSFGKFRERLVSLLRSGKFPELQCHLRRWMLTFFWEHCGSTFLLENHFSSDDVSSSTEFARKIELLAKQPFRKGEPLWEIVIYPNYEDKEHGTRSAWALRVHHSLTDGFAMINLVKCLEDRNTDVDDYLREMKKKQAEKESCERKNNLLSAFLFILQIIFYSPFHSVYSSLKCIDHNIFTIPPSRRRRKENQPFNNNLDLSLAFVKDVARRENVSFAAVLLAGYASALRETMLKKGVKIHKDLSAMFVWPKPGRRRTTLTNRALPVPVSLPVSVPDGHLRLRIIHENLEAWRRNPANCKTLLYLEYMLGVIEGVVGVRVNQFHTGSMIITNFPWIGGLGKILGEEQVVMNMVGGTQEQMTGMIGGAIGFGERLVLGATADQAIFKGHEEAKYFVDLVVQEIKRLSKIGLEHV